MNILLYGGTGYIGRHVGAELLAQGHQVTAFARNEQGAAALRALGARPMLGSLDDPAAATAAFEEHDAVIWAAQVMLEQELALAHAFIDALRGSHKAFVFTSGTSLLSERTNGNWSEKTYAEDEPFVPRRQIAPRLEIENLVRQSSDQGIRAVCIRPPLVWGNGGSKVISDLYHSVQRTGAVCYVGRGLNVYSNVHVQDLARMYSLVLEKGVPGALYHAVTGEQNYRTIAQAIANHLDVPTRSVTVSEAAEIWDKFTGPIVFSSCSRTRAPRARADLGWAPSEDRLDILEDCTHPGYAKQEARGLPAWVRPREAA